MNRCWWPHRQLFGCPVHFGMDSNAVTLPSLALDRPVPLADSRLRRYSPLPWPQGALNDRANAKSVRLVVTRLLRSGECTADAVAAELDVSRRTLNRHLAAGGDRFGSVLAQVRLELARQYLASGSLNMTQIADLLGFATLSSFSCWHSQHTRVAPSHWREGATRG